MSSESMISNHLLSYIEDLKGVEELFLSLDATPSMHT